jgi:hypothetical protein
VWNVKIQEKAQLVTTQPQIREQLSAMDRQHSFHALDLDNKTPFDDEIDAVRGVELNTLVHDGQPDFLFEMEARLGELIGQTGATGAFEDSGTEGSVDAHGGVEHDAAGGVGFHENPMCA